MNNKLSKVELVERNKELDMSNHLLTIALSDTLKGDVTLVRGKSGHKIGLIRPNGALGVAVIYRQGNEFVGVYPFEKWFEDTRIAAAYGCGTNQEATDLMELAYEVQKQVRAAQGVPRH